ncbi:MAG: PilX N-terminal domain-containing pilus assembly protein [Candidatus Zixiibacteriota bacterium]
MSRNSYPMDLCRRPKGSSDQSGMAAVMALLMVGMLTLIGLAALSTSDDEVQVAGNQFRDTRAFYAAEAGLETATAAVQTEYELTGFPPTTLPSGSDSINESVVSYTTVDNGPAVQKTLTSGNLSGLHALVKEYTITSDATSDVDRARTVLVQRFEAAQVPIFQFAVFYDDELWTSPAEKMTINGRVHANGDICLQSSNGLYLDSYLSSAGNIYHGYKYGLYPGVNGDVAIKDRVGLYQSMKVGGTWLDANDTEWYSKAATRWGGQVQDKAFGQEKLNVPLTNKGEPHKLIERATGNPDSYENKATLKIINGQALKFVAGTWVDVTADMTTKGIITATTDKFYDSRDKKYVDVCDLDVTKLYSNGYGPDNGVLYFSDDIAASSEWPALRLKNATSLGAGLTIASENPVYTVGNFNTSDKKPAAILTDALTILSANWDDAKSTQSKSNRQAVSTTVNASFITGDTYLGPGKYNGGLANLPRFLEYWGDARTASICGSMVNLWQSMQAKGDWSLDYYEPPTRNWIYDIDLDDPAKQPPDAPKILVFRRGGWMQQDVAYTTNE